MIKKISFSLIFICLLIAIPLALLGFKKVELGASGLALLRISEMELHDFKIEIPFIPQIPLFEPGDAWDLVLTFLIKVVNGLSSLINFIITILNTIIQVIEYIVIVIKNLITFKDTVAPIIYT